MHSLQLYVYIDIIKHKIDPKMQASPFSKKDGQYIQQQFKSIIDNHYDSPTAQTQTQIILLNTLITQSISNAVQLDSQQIIPKLQVLKIKSKSKPNLLQSIVKAVQHLKSPVSNNIKIDTIQACLQHKELVEICCLVLQRLAKSKLKSSMGIQEICRVCRKVYQGCARWKYSSTMLDTLIQIINNFRNLPEQAGLDQSSRYLLSTQSSTIASSKPQTQKLFRLITQSCHINPTIIHTYQPQLATLLYMQPSIIFQFEQILSICYNQTYCSKFINNNHKIDNTNNNIDGIYVWSHSSMFCIQATQQIIYQLENILKQKHIKADIQYKVYATINNFVVVNDFTIQYAWNMPVNLNEKVVNAYLIMISNVLAHSSNADKQKQKLNLAAMEKIFIQKKLDSEATKKLIKDVKQHLTSTHMYSHMSFAKKLQQKTSSTSSSSHNQFIMQTLLEKANKIPKSDEDLKITHEILSYSPKSEDPIQLQNLRSIKNRALDSLKISLLQSQSLYFQKIFNFLQLQIYDIYTLKRLLQIANFQLKINPKSATVINVYHLGKIILKIQQKDHDILDFQQLAEIFYICLGGELWDSANMENTNKNKQQWAQYVIQRIKMIKQEDYKIKENRSFQDAVDHITDMIGKITINDNQSKRQTASSTNSRIIQQKKESRIQAPSSKIQTLQQQSPNKMSSTVVPPVPSIIEPSRISQPSTIMVQQKPSIKPPSEIDLASIAAASNKLKQNVRTYNFLQTNRNLSIKNIILKYKIKSAVKAWIKRTKKSKQRLYKLREWAETQKSYMQKLLVLRYQIQAPLLKNQLINQLQASMIFPNLDAMIKLCDQMNVKISQLLSTWNPITTQLAPSLKSVTNFLRIYKNYSQNYDKSYQMMKKLAEDPEYNKCVKVVNIDNYLFSPVQRFQKYHLFVSEYLRNLPPGHKDLGPLQIELNFLLKVTDQINEFMEFQNRAKKMVQMQKKFGNVVSNSRQYIIQFIAYCFQFKCKIYGFNDLLIVAKINQYNTQQLYMRIKLCGKSVTWKQPDCKSFKNRLFICGLDTSIHLTFESLADMQNAHKFINEIIQTLYQNQYKRLDLIYQAQSRIKSGQISTRTSKIQIDFQLIDNNKYQRLQLSAQVIGIDKMFYHGVLLTYFIIKAQIIKPYEIYQVLYCELGVLDDLEKHLQLLYPGVKCPSLEIKNKDVTSDDLTKVGEYLCVVIQKFLNFVLRNKTIMQKPQRVLFKLGLHQSLWAFLMANKSQIQCSCEVCAHAQIYTDASYYQKQRKLIQSNIKKFCILNSFNTQNTIRTMSTKQNFQYLPLQLKLVQILNRMHRIDHRLQPPTTFGKPIPLKVCVKMLSDDIIIDVKNVTVFTSCREVIQQVCARLRIQSTLDLALVFAQDQNQIIIDDDQYLTDFAKFVQQAEQQEKKIIQANSQNSGRFSFFSRLSSFSAEQPKKYKKLQFCLRKIICLPFAQEEKEIQQNLQRSRFIAGQILRKFQNHIMFLSVQDCRLLCGMLYSIQNFSSLIVQKKVHFKEQKLKKYIPQSKWDMITKDFIDKTIHIVQNQIQSTDKIGVLYRALLKSFWLKFSFQFFAVQNTEPSELLGNFKSLYVGVNYKKITVTRKQTSVSLLEYPITDFKYRVYGDSLFVESEEKQHCFKASNLFMLDKIIKTYRVLHEFQQ